MAKKSTVSTLREKATANHEVIKTNEKLTAKLKFFLAKTDVQLMKIDEKVLQEVIEVIDAYVAEVNAAKSEVKKPEPAKPAKTPADKADVPAKSAAQVKPKKTKEKPTAPEVIIPAEFVYEVRNEEDQIVKYTMTRVDAFTTIEDVAKFQETTVDAEGNDTLYVAFNWPKDLLKDYILCLDVPAPKKGFMNDLDLCSIAHIRYDRTMDKATHIYAMSVETEGMYFVHADEVKKLENKDYAVMSGDTPMAFFHAAPYVEPVATPETEVKTEKSKTAKQPKPKVKTPETEVKEDQPETKTPKKPLKNKA